MNITYRLDNNIIYIAIEGRIDASNAAIAEEEIFNNKNDNNDKHLVIDAEKAMIIGYTRMLRRAISRPNEADSPAKIARCKEMLEILLDKVDTLTF